MKWKRWDEGVLTSRSLRVRVALCMRVFSRRNCVLMQKPRRQRRSRFWGRVRIVQLNERRLWLSLETGFAESFEVLALVRVSGRFASALWRGLREYSETRISGDGFVSRDSLCNDLKAVRDHHFRIGEGLAHALAKLVTFASNESTVVIVSFVFSKFTISVFAT